MLARTDIRWKQEEDDLLLELVTNWKNQWQIITKKYNKKFSKWSDKQIQFHWENLVKNSKIPIISLTK